MGIKSCFCHKEANNVRSQFTLDAENYLINLLKDYGSDHAFKMGDIALFTELGLSYKLSCSKVIGTKISKKCVTLALCANSAGCTKIKPFLINNVSSSRIFKQTKILIL